MEKPDDDLISFPTYATYPFRWPKGFFLTSPVILLANVLKLIVLGQWSQVQCVLLQYLFQIFLFFQESFLNYIIFSIYSLIPFSITKYLKMSGLNKRKWLYHSSGSYKSQTWVFIRVSSFWGLCRKALFQASLPESFHITFPLSCLCVLISPS